MFLKQSQRNYFIDCDPEFSQGGKWHGSNLINSWILFLIGRRTQQVVNIRDTDKTRFNKKFEALGRIAFKKLKKNTVLDYLLGIRRILKFLLLVSFFKECQESPCLRMSRNSKVLRVFFKECQESEDPQCLFCLKNVKKLRNSSCLFVERERFSGFLQCIFLKEYQESPGTGLSFLGVGKNLWVNLTSF